MSGQCWFDETQIEESPPKRPCVEGVEAMDATAAELIRLAIQQANEASERSWDRRVEDLLNRQDARLEQRLMQHEAKVEARVLAVESTVAAQIKDLRAELAKVAQSSGAAQRYDAASTTTGGGGREHRPLTIDIKGYCEFGRVKEQAMPGVDAANFLKELLEREDMAGCAKHIDKERTLRVSEMRVFCYKLCVYMINDPLADSSTMRSRCWEVKRCIDEALTNITINGKKLRVMVEQPSWKQENNRLLAKARAALSTVGVASEKVKTEWGRAVELYYSDGGGRPRLLAALRSGEWQWEQETLRQAGTSTAAVQAALDSA